MIVELVFVGEHVDQTGTLRIAREERALVDQRAHVLDFFLAALGDAAHELFVHVARQRLGHLAMRRRKRRLGQLIGRRLVVADFFEVGLRADLVERALEKHLIGRDAR